MRRFNDLADFSREEIKELIALAARLDAKPEPRALEGKVLSLLFLSPSLRTLSSFQAAMLRLGGGSFVISPDMSIHGLESRFDSDQGNPEVLLDVHAERLERRYVKDVKLVRKRALETSLHQLVDDREKGGEGLARARRRGNQRMLAALDEGPGARLDLGGLSQCATEPCGGDGMKSGESHASTISKWKTRRKAPGTFQESLRERR